MPPAAIRRGVAGVCLTAGVALAGAAAVSVAQWPATAAAPTGQTIYDARCASCHGAAGMGDGPAASLLSPAPRDFTSGVYRFRSTPSGSLPTDDDLLRAVAEGIAGTSMIGWKGILSDGEMRAVAGYVKSFSPRFASERRAPVTLAPETPAGAASVAAGRAVYVSLQCGACHGESGDPDASVAGTLEDDSGRRLRTTRLSEPWTFKGGSSARDIALRVKTGIDGTPMPPAGDAATDNDLWDLAHYVRSLARKPVWAMTAGELTAHYAQLDRARAADPVDRGRQLAGACAHCHSPVDRDGRIIPGMTFAGGVRVRLSIWGDAVTANLTSDKETGLGRYTDAEILNAVTRGIRRDGSRMLPFPMGWTAWAHLTDGDQRALVAYLRTIPPVRNRITQPARPGVFTYLQDKFRLLILGADDPLVFYAGNAGVLSEGQVTR